MGQMTRKTIEKAVKEVLAGYRIKGKDIALLHRRLHIEHSHTKDMTKSDREMMHEIYALNEQLKDADARYVLNRFLENNPMPHLTAKYIQNIAAYIYQQGYFAGRARVTPEPEIQDIDLSEYEKDA